MASEKGGYDCRFVESPPEQLQSKCPVCLCVLRDPYMTNCCGYSFCQTCIQAIQDQNKVCPLCNQQFAAYPDKRLSRTLKGMKIFCIHANSGCEWQGLLGDVDKHLNTLSLDDDMKTVGCMYEPVPCDYCNVLIKRQSLSHHQVEECRKRPFSCDYCHEYASTCDDVTLNHWLHCPSRPVTCPNECGVYPERRDLQQHLCNECQMATVKCQFSCYGCDAVVKRKDMPDHLTKAVVNHLSLQSEHCRSCFARYENRLKDCEEKIASLEMENASLKSTLQSLKREQEVSACVDKPSGNNKPTHAVTVSSGSHPWRLNGAESKFYLEELEKLRSHMCILPLQFTVHTVCKLQRDKTKWVSMPFYTHAQGYKLCLKVYPGGHFTSLGTDLSLYVCIMKGEYDDWLQWPFRGTLPIQVLDQVHGKDHVGHSVKFSDDTSGEFSGRVVNGEVSGGWGILKFIPLDRLVPKYLHNDCLLFRVDLSCP